jgi:hypothetical protein
MLGSIDASMELHVCGDRCVSPCKQRTLGLLMMSDFALHEPIFVSTEPRFRDSTNN